MLLDRVLGNVASDGTGRFAGMSQDVLELTWRQCTRRAVRCRTVGGRDVGVLLPPGTSLRHGDVLAEDGGCLVVVAVIPCEVWVAKFRDAASMAAAALELGNLHVPVEVEGLSRGLSRLITPPDGPSRRILDRHATSWRPEIRRFQPLRATVAGANIRLSPTFKRISAAPQVRKPQLTNNRE